MAAIGSTYIGSFNCVTTQEERRGIKSPSQGQGFQIMTPLWGPQWNLLGTTDLRLPTDTESREIGGKTNNKPHKVRSYLHTGEL